MQRKQGQLQLLNKFRRTEEATTVETFIASRLSQATPKSARPNADTPMSRLHNEDINYNDRNNNADGPISPPGEGGARNVGGGRE